MGEFADKEAAKSFLNEQACHAPFPYKEKNLNACFMDARKLLFNDSTFDFAFSLSSIEHFGGVEQAGKALREMARVVQPGGVVVIATEVSLNGSKTDEVFGLNDLKKLVKESQLTLLEAFDFSLSEDSASYLTDTQTDDINKLPHLNLKLLHSCFTSGILF